MANPNTQFLETRLVRAAAVLTDSYVAGTVLTNLEGCNQLVLFVDYTEGSLDSCEIKIEFYDGTQYTQEKVGTYAAGVTTYADNVHQFTATGKYAIYLPIKCQAVKVSAKGTGTVTDSSLKITAGVGVS